MLQGLTIFSLQWETHWIKQMDTTFQEQSYHFEDFIVLLGIILVFIEFASILSVSYELPLKIAFSNYTTAFGNAGSLTYWARPGIKPTFPQTLCQFLNPLNHKCNPEDVKTLLACPY